MHLANLVQVMFFRAKPSPFFCLAFAGAGMVAVLGCGAGDPGEVCAEGDPACECAGGHCDLPDTPDGEACTLRRAEAYTDSRPAYGADFLRWSCANVEGVTEEDLGQEYCEFFAIADLPPEYAGDESPEPAILGRNLGPDSSFGTTDTGTTLSPDQIAALEDAPEAVIGACVFSSWNSDEEAPVAGCAEGACPEVAGVEVTADVFRDTFDKNSTEAAQLLVSDCLLTLPEDGDPQNGRDPLNDDFYRGCMLNVAINDTSFSKADSTICPAAMRLGECACYVDDPDLDFAEVISPAGRRGFPMGTWSGFVLGDEAATELPVGCAYVALGDDSQTVVACDLTAGDVLDHASDLKGFCHDQYADSLVIHVPIPGDLITCYGDEAEGPYAASCTQTPWVVTP
ncbi:MAG TPA: hypothetical protein VFG83_11800 [Kofleriaceae bacterium]|nr:hypothetical protein [Kofleriaceae bacterium]